MLLRERQSVERNAKNRMRLPMPGGMQQKLISAAFQIVSLLLPTAGTITYHRVAPTVAIQALTQTIVHLTQGGRFRQAADREKEIGQIYLQESNDLRRACESYERAGDWYAQEDATAYVSR